nr:WecB/TagA/CpsF family glycosyltransferase [Segatella copri]
MYLGCLRSLVMRDEDGNEDNKAIIDAINAANPDLLRIGMTAPKQEKWAYSHWNELNIHCHVGTIGAVFDFFVWRRYIIGNTLFLWNMVKEA